ncbi:unnamed protein product [Spirodela intermedia]|uniref:Uncharacterized protein n=1 Tax=Spirodela intermedia TaxID=51605 RepID=A0A7I8IIZ3_SPIIN|nr:unnamed protein product [Spirodela intermedia]CAA6657845.1 unnamed protein product [Spirodela intermedia]
MRCRAKIIAINTPVTRREPDSRCACYTAVCTQSARPIVGMCTRYHKGPISQ